MVKACDLIAWRCIWRWWNNEFLSCLRYWGQIVCVYCLLLFLDLLSILLFSLVSGRELPHFLSHYYKICLLFFFYRSYDSLYKELITNSIIPKSLDFSIQNVSVSFKACWSASDCPTSTMKSNTWTFLASGHPYRLKEVRGGGPVRGGRGGGEPTAISGSCVKRKALKWQQKPSLKKSKRRTEQAQCAESMQMVT